MPIYFGISQDIQTCLVCDLPAVDLYRVPFRWDAEINSA
jgi:hypothetical protein